MVAVHQMKLKFWLFIPLFFFSLITANGQASGETSPFKIVGYYSLRAAQTADLKKVPFKSLTHINLWFLNPDTLGNFTQDFTALEPFVKAAHKKNVKVLASIGGGTQQPYYEKLLKEEHRARFIQNLVEVVLRHNLDGIDVDLEGKDIGENYEGFVVDLAKALRAHNKLITAAIAVYYKDALTDKALAQYDFVNIMSYDRTGPWRPEKPGPHSTFTHAVQDLQRKRLAKRADDTWGALLRLRLRSHPYQPGG
jgi:chitinase